MIHRYPAQVKAFYMKRDLENPDLALCSDLLAPEGYGEIIGGSQRSTDFKEILAKLKASGASRKDYEFYLDSRKYGDIPHAGFGLGIERMIQWFCKLDSIRDAIPFPRTPSRVYP